MPPPRGNLDWQAMLSMALAEAMGKFSTSFTRSRERKWESEDREKQRNQMLAHQYQMKMHGAKSESELRAYSKAIEGLIGRKAQEKQAPQTVAESWRPRATTPEFGAAVAGALAGKQPLPESKVLPQPFLPGASLMQALRQPAAGSYPPGSFESDPGSPRQQVTPTPGPWPEAGEPEWERAKGMRGGLWPDHEGDRGRGPGRLPGSTGSQPPSPGEAVGQYQWADQQARALEGALGAGRSDLALAPMGPITPEVSRESGEIAPLLAEALTKGEHAATKRGREQGAESRREAEERRKEKMFPLEMAYTRAKIQKLLKGDGPGSAAARSTGNAAIKVGMAVGLVDLVVDGLSLHDIRVSPEERQHIQTALKTKDVASFAAALGRHSRYGNLPPETQNRVERLKKESDSLHAAVVRMRIQDYDPSEWKPWAEQSASLAKQAQEILRTAAKRLGIETENRMIDAFIPKDRQGNYRSLAGIKRGTVEQRDAFRTNDLSRWGKQGYVDKDLTGGQVIRVGDVGLMTTEDVDILIERILATFPSHGAIKMRTPRP